MTAHNTSRPNTPTEQNKEDNTLLIYRIGILEDKVDDVALKLDRQNFPTREEIKADLKEFQETIVTRFLEMRADLQKQIDKKADASELKDLKRNFYAGLGFVTTIILAIVVAYLTTKGG